MQLNFFPLKKKSATLTLFQIKSGIFIFVVVPIKSYTLKIKSDNI